MGGEVLETRTGWTSLDGFGILKIVFKPDCGKQTLEDAKANVESSRALLAGRRAPLFCDFRAVTGQTRECQMYYASLEVAEVYSACAIFLKSPASKMIASFFLGLRRPVVPTRLFTNEETAYSWLKSFLK